MDHNADRDMDVYKYNYPTLYADVTSLLLASKNMQSILKDNQQNGYVYVN